MKYSILSLSMKITPGNSVVPSTSPSTEPSFTVIVLSDSNKSFAKVVVPALLILL